VETRHLDGDGEAQEIDDWYKMELEQIEPPEEWVGSMYDFKSGDMAYSDTQISDDYWHEGRVA
jgi:hypothetical protein